MSEGTRIIVQVAVRCQFCGEEFHITQQTWNYCDIADKALEDFMKEHEDCPPCPPP